MQLQDAIRTRRTHKAYRAEPVDRATLEDLFEFAQAGEAIRDRKNILATALAAYVVLLAAHDRELAGYWRTPAVLRDPRACDALGIGRDEEFVGLLYFGYPRGAAGARAPARDGRRRVP